MKFRTIFLIITILVLSASIVSAQDVKTIQPMLEKIDTWVTSDTAKIMEFIDSSDAVAKETLKASKFWQPVEDKLSFLLGIDYLGSPQIDNTGRIYFMMRITGEESALFYVDEPMGWPIQITPNNWPAEGIIISRYSVHPSIRRFYHCANQCPWR
jgi:hypothetical protein